MTVMQARLLLFFFLQTTAGFLFAQEPGEELLEWSHTRKLTWADYKAAPNPNSDAAASTTSYLGFSYSVRNEGFSYRIESKFSKTRSWGLHKTPYILSHEQGHFDIAEVFARKLEKKMKEYRFNPKTYQKDLSKIYRDILDEKEEMQNDYDRETNHSINREKQAAWLKKIEALLQEYEPWADYSKLSKKGGKPNQNNPYSSASTLRMISPKSSSRSANLFLSTSITSSLPSL